MPNITGYSETTDPNWIQVQFDDGSGLHVSDPSGQYRQEVSEIASKIMGKPAAPSPYSGAVAGPGGDAASSPVSSAAPPLPSGAPPTAAETASLAMTPAEQASLSSESPAPAAAPLVTPAEQAGLTASPADLAGLRRGLGEATHGGAAPAPAPYVLPKGAIDMDAPEGSPAPVVPPVAAAPAPAPSAMAPVIGQVTQDQDHSRTQDQNRSSSGYVGADRARIDRANAAASDAQRKADEAAAAVKTEQVNNEWNSLSAQQKQLLARQAQLDEQKRDYDEKVGAATQKLTADLSRKIDPSLAFGGDAGHYAFMAAFGDSLQNFGAALAGRGPVANPSATLDRIIQRSVDLQTQQKEVDYKAGKITIDELTANREFVRARILGVQKQLADNMLARTKTQGDAIALKAAGADADAKQKAAIAKAAEATARKDQSSDAVKTVSSDASKTTAEVGISNELTQALRAKGVTPKAFSDGLEKKTGAGEAAPTLGHAIGQLQQLDGDRKALESLAAANGGKLPTKGDFNIPHSLVPYLARLGYQPGMDAEHVQQLIIPRVIAAAKAMGSRVTEKELDIAAESTGSSTAALFRSLDRVRDQSNESIKSTAEAAWPGVSQEVLDLYRRGVAGTQGVPAATGITPFEVHGGPDPAEAPRALSDVEQQQARNRASAGRSVGSAVSAVGNAVIPLRNPASINRGPRF